MNRSEWSKEKAVGRKYYVKGSYGFVSGVAVSVFDDANKHGAVLKFVEDYLVNFGYYPCEMMNLEKPVLGEGKKARVIQKCIICGKEFEANSRKQKICSYACRSKYATLKNREYRAKKKASSK